MTLLEENKIIEVISRIGTDKLRSIRENLPEEIGYEKIRLVVVKIKRETRKNVL